ncbi:Hsp20/alpha crystallin family protein [Variovorax dokdonensis]|uniref:Hsp20/alpha crystallin family protein n=1 Tax=Variovorax dokdonensis TaxID=344883 RepID=A0ABT7NBS4_9BURK|nr:Hsp20/alpha crystallin family protein [Variovorax dokdonensis]MDM0045367.1 Hsp20/alpha crystallin family protein [Variovorax dokdonensis]
MNAYESLNTRRAPATRPQEGPRYDPSALTPPVDVTEDPAGITLHADLPGVSSDKLQLQVEADTLTIAADVGLTLPEGLQTTHTEVGIGRFHRSFTLSKELDTEKISAQLVNGVLTLRIPKAQHAQPRRISIDVNSD